MKKSFLILLTIFSSLAVSYATWSFAYPRKSPNLLWQWVPDWYYDPVNHVGDSYKPEFSYEFISGTKWPTGVVKDNKTWLIWESQWSDPYVVLNWYDAWTYCHSLNKGGYPVGTWRVPSIQELATIDDWSNYNPNDTFFVVSWKYWSSTQAAFREREALYMWFGIGIRTNPFFGEMITTLCVRDNW